MNAARVPPRDDEGSALVEFVGLAVLLLLPLVYVLLSAFSVQRAAFAVTQAAREAGRAYASAPSASLARVRAAYAAQLALESQGVPGAAIVRYAPAGSGCSAAGGDAAANLRPGTRFVVCVRSRAALPLGGSLTVNGQYTATVDRYRTDVRSARIEAGRRSPARDDAGTILLLTLGCVALALMLVVVVVDASAVFLARRGLAADSDGAALAAAQSVSTARVYAGGAGGRLPLADVQRVVAGYDAGHPSMLTATVRHDTGGDTVIVSGRRDVRLPFAAMFGIGPVTVMATSQAASVRRSEGDT